jgi:hypothetical protein
MLILSLFSFFLFLSPAHAGWILNCENYCAFREFSPNCQGIYWQYSDGYRGYSEWSPQYNGCLEKRTITTDVSQLSSHLITPNYISCNCGTPSVYPPAQSLQPISQTTRDKLALLRDQIRTWTTCAPAPTSATPLNNPIKFNDIKSCRQLKLENKVTSFFKINRCEYGLSAWNHDCEYHGDLPGAVFWMCLAGDTDRCNDIKRAQNPTTGAWFRNDHQRLDFRAGRDQPLFSRDHTLGALGYLVATADKPAALKWLTFIRDNPKILGMHNICPPRPNVPKPPELTQLQWDNMLPDDRCDVRMNLWGLFYLVYKYIGFTDAELQSISSGIYNAMMFAKTIDLGTLSLTADTVPSAGAGAYQIQLVADEIQIRLAAGQSYSDLSNIINKVNNRTSKIQPRYHFLANNRVATEYGAYLIQKYCRPQRPSYGYWSNSGNQSAIFENAPTGKWYWGGSIDSGSYQYFGSYDAYDRRWLENGHECINWINLYLGNAEERVLTCDPGEVIVDGACRTVAFPRAVIPPVAGLGYRTFWPWESTVLSGLVNRKNCFTTGSVSIGDPEWDDTYYNYCTHPGIVPMQFDIPNVSEYVDANPLFPGVYYNLVNNNCPHGGTKINNACRIIEFTKPVPSLYLGINYWVDNNPSWPGVYYAGVNGTCPYGGSGGSPNCQLYAAPPGKLRTDRQYFIRRNAKHPGIFHYPRLGPIFNYGGSSIGNPARANTVLRNNL